jgi:hypothetical protein
MKENLTLQENVYDSKNTEWKLQSASNEWELLNSETQKEKNLRENIVEHL